MNTLRILIIAIAILIILLYIIPKNSNSIYTEKKINNILLSLLLFLITTAAIVTYYYKDSILANRDLNHPLLIKIKENKADITTIKITAFDLQNINPTILANLLIDNKHITGIKLSNVNRSNVDQLINIIIMNNNITDLFISQSSYTYIINILNNLNKQNIKNIYLQHNELTLNTDFKDLIHILNSFTNLEHLDLQYNKLSKSDLIIIKQSLPKHIEIIL